MAQRGKFYSPWCDFANYLLADHKISQRELERRMGITQSIIQAILVGRSMAPQDPELGKWADAMELTGADRDKFIFLADLARAPTRISKIVEALMKADRGRKSEIAALERQAQAMERDNYQLCREIINLTKQLQQLARKLGIPVPAPIPIPDREAPAEHQQ